MQIFPPNDPVPANDPTGPRPGYGPDPDYVPPQVPGRTPPLIPEADPILPPEVNEGDVVQEPVSDRGDDPDVIEPGIDTPTDGDAPVI